MINTEIVLWAPPLKFWHGATRGLNPALYTGVMLLTFILIIISIPSRPHSFIPGLKPFLQILPTVTFISFFRTDSTDSPDCLPILLSLVFFHFLVVGSVR